MNDPESTANLLNYNHTDRDHLAEGEGEVPGSAASDHLGQRAAIQSPETSKNGCARTEDAMTQPHLAVCFGVIMLAASQAPAATFLGPTPYLSFNDSPFKGVPFAYFHLEDFESSGLTTPGVTVSVGANFLNPGATTDSVDEDDGAVDGSGTSGISLYSAVILSAFRFTFNPAALGALPNHVGIAWTDVGFVSGGQIGFGGVIVEAFGPGNVSLGTSGAVVLGDGDVTGATAEDRFFGVMDPGGIEAFEIRMNSTVDWEVDHLQYGLTQIPEPSTWTITVAVVLLSGFQLLRQHRVSFGLLNRDGNNSRRRRSLALTRNSS
jgi:hypothetical protein